MATDAGATAAEVAPTSRLVRRVDDREGAVNSLRRQLHLPTPADCPLGVCLMDAALVFKTESSAVTKHDVLELLR